MVVSFYIHLLILPTKRQTGSSLQCRRETTLSLIVLIAHVRILAFYFNTIEYWPIHPQHRLTECMPRSPHLTSRAPALIGTHQLYRCRQTISRHFKAWFYARQ